MGDDTKRKTGILTELAHHFPFTILSAIFAVCAMALVTVLGGMGEDPSCADAESACSACHSDDAAGHSHDAAGHSHDAAGHSHDAAGHSDDADEEGEHPEHGHDSPCERLFHVFHPIHILLSAMATSAMFWRFEKKLIKAVLVGLIGSLGVCGISDIVMPFAGGRLLGTAMTFHFCLIEDPWLILPFAVLGVFVGLLSSRTMPGRGATIFSHSAHVAISTMASLLYLIAFGFYGWMADLFQTFVLLILAVLIPCCMSDIFFPLLMVEKGRILHDHEGHSHCCP